MNASRVLRPVIVVAIIFALIAAGIGFYLFNSAKDQTADSKETVIINLSDASDDHDVKDKQIVGGDLRVSGDIEVAEGLSASRVTITTSAGDTLSAGQIYIDDNHNLHYYDGDESVNISRLTEEIEDLRVIVAEQGQRIPGNIDVGVLTLQGQSGNVALGAGNGVSINGTTISNTGVTGLGGRTGNINLGSGLAISGGSLVNTRDAGVTSLGGQTGNIAIGSGLAVSGGVLVNTASNGVQSLISGSSNIVVTDDGSGNLTITETGSGSGGTVALGPVSAQIDSSNQSSIWINKTGSGNLLQLSTGASPVNRFVVDQTGAILTGTIGFSQITGLPSFINSIDGADGAISLGSGLSRSGQTLTNSGVLSIAGLNGAVSIGQGLAVSGGTLIATQSGVSSVDGTPNQIIASGGPNIVLSLPQDIDVTSTPTFANINLTTPLDIASGGTGANDAAGARANIGAAARGMNSDITSLLGLTTALSVSQGGTGASSFAQNGVIVGQGTGPLSSVVAGANGQCLISTATGPTFQTCPGSGGIATVTGTTDQVIVTGTNDITLSLPQSIAVTSAPTFSALTLSSALGIGSGGTGASNSTAARTNLGAAASGINSDITQLTGLSNVSSAGSLTIDAVNNNLTLQGANTTISSYAAGLSTSLTFAAPTANVTYRLQTAAAGTYDVCTTAGNCVGVGGGVTTPGGTVDRLAKFSGSGSIVDSLISDDGTSVFINGLLRTDTLSTLGGLSTINIPNASGTMAVSASGNIDLSSTGNISFVGLLPVSQGGTGANTAVGARTNLGAAASGANTDITSLLGLTTALSVSQGGTGATNLTQNGVVIGQGTSGLMAVTASGAGQCLVSTASGAPEFQSCPGAGGVASITGTPNQVIVSGSGNLTLSLPQDIAVSSSPTFAGLTLSSALTVANGGTGSNTAVGARTNLGAAASGANADITSLSSLTSVNAASPLAISSTGNLTLQGANTTLTATDSGFSSNLTFVAPTANVTYRLQTAAAGTYDICTTAGNCVGVGGGVTTPGGTAGRLAKFSGSGSIVDSLLSDDGTAISVDGVLKVDTISTLSGSNTILVPNGSGTIAISASGPLTLDANGNLDCANCLTDGGGSGGAAGVSSVNGMTGALTINSVTGSSIVNSGATITIQDASATVKGLAAFNTDNLTVTSGVVNTVQDISVSSAPTFAGLRVTGSAALTLGSSGNAGGILFNDGTSAFRASLVAGSYSANQSIVVPNASGTMAVSASGNIALSPTGNISFTGVLPVTNGGTGANNATDARTNLGAAASGANADITSLLGLTTALSVSQGGTGTSNLAQNGVLIGQGTSGINSLVAGTAGQCLMSTAGAPVWQACPGGGGVDSLNGVSGDITLTGQSIGSVSTAGDTITIHNASDTTKGLASFSAANFTVSDGHVDTIQGISTTSSPTFNALNLTTALGLASGGTGVSATPNVGQLLIGTGTGYSLSTLTAGIGIDINNAAGAITISAPTAGTCALCANQSLSNLSAVAINTNLLPGVSSTIDLGSSALTFRNGYFDGTLSANVLDAASAGALAIGTTNATAINLNQDTVLAANKTLTVTGGNTAGRPVAPTEGTIYFDTTTKQLLTYADGKWKSDKSTADKIIAASNSPQAMKDAADVIVNGDTAAANDGDQIEINAALTAAAGGTVYLAQGKYTVDGTILIPDNTTLSGAGRSTVIELAAVNVNDNLIEAIGGTYSRTGQTVQNLRLDGRKDLNTSGTQTGIYFYSVGRDDSTPLRGGNILNVEVNNFNGQGIRTAGLYDPVTTLDNVVSSNNNSYGIELSGAIGTTLNRVTAENNGAAGFRISGSYISIRDSFSRGNNGDGYTINASHVTITGVRAGENGGRGVYIGGSSAKLLDSHIYSNVSDGVRVYSGGDATINSNRVVSNARGVYLDYGASDAKVTNNTIISNNGHGLETNRSGDNAIISGNYFLSNAGYGIYSVGYVNQIHNHTVSDNVFRDNTSGGMVMNTTQSVISGNTLENNGGSTHNNGIMISGGYAHSNTVSDNIIWDSACTTSCVAISINSSRNTLLSNNTIDRGADGMQLNFYGTDWGKSTISDTGVNTIYSNQRDSDGNLINRGTGATTINTSTVTSSLSLQGGMSNTKLPTPGTPTTERTGASGTTYGYMVTALDGTGETLPSTQRTVSAAAVLDASNYVTISWSSIPGAVSYNIYRTTSAGDPASLGLIGNVVNNNLGSVKFVDNGLPASTAPPTSNTTGGASIAGFLQAGGSALVGGNLTAGGTLYSEKLPDPDVLPASTVYGLSYSPDGQYLIVAHNSSPFITIYKRSGDAYTKLPNPDILPTGTGRDVAWSPDGQYVSIAHLNAPHITVYKRSGDTFTNLTLEAPISSSLGYSTAWSPDGQYLSLGHGGGDYVTLYKRSGDAFTKLPNLSDRAPGNPVVTWSPDGEHFIAVGGTTGGVAVYKQTGDDFEKLPNPPSTVGVNDIAFSPNGNYFSVAHQGYPFMSIYKRSGDTYVKLPSIPDPPVDYILTSGYGTAWSSDSKHVALTTGGQSPYLYVYQRFGDNFERLPDVSVPPAATANGAAFSPDGQHLAVGHANGSRIAIYKRGTNNLHGNLNVSGQGNVWGDLTVSDRISAENVTVSREVSAATVSVGTADNTGSVVFKNTNDGNSVTITTDSVSSSYTLTLPSAIGEVGQCLVDTTGAGVLGWVNCGVGGSGESVVALQASSPGLAQEGSFNIDGTGIAGTLQALSSVQTSSVDTISAGDLNIGGANATGINLSQNTTLAANKSLTITGGGTSTRPLAPAEGTIYFDSTAKTLVLYADGMWKDLEPKTDMIMVAASDSPASMRAVADYVADGEDSSGSGLGAIDGDQVQINQALNEAEASGVGTVYLAEGTYTVDGSIQIPNNTTLAGAGNKTLVQFGNFGSADIILRIVQNKSNPGSNIGIKDLSFDGRRDINTDPDNTQAIRMVNVGSDTLGSETNGLKVDGIEVRNFPGQTIYLNNTINSNIKNSLFVNNGNDSSNYKEVIQLANSHKTTISDNAFRSNRIGINLVSSSSDIVITNNEIHNTVSYGIEISSSDRIVMANNAISGGNTGIYFGSGNSKMTVEGNTISNTSSNGIWIHTLTESTFDGNLIMNSAGTGLNLMYGLDHSTVSNNVISGSAGSGISNFFPAEYVNITGNIIKSNDGSGIYLELENSQITDNKLHDNGGPTANNAIRINGGDNNSVADNHISDTSCTSTCRAIVITSATRTHLSDNILGGGTIYNTSPSTSYSNQLDGNGKMITSGGSSLDIGGSMNVTGLPTPSAPGISRVGTSDVFTDYRYRVTALDASGESLPSAEASYTIGHSAMDSVNYLRITINQVPGAVSYNVYRTLSEGTPSSLGLIGNVPAGPGATVSLNDTGLEASGAMPTTNTTGSATVSGNLTTNGTLSALGGGTHTIGGTLQAGVAKFQNATDSTSAFQIVNAAGAELLSADTTNMTVTVTKLVVSTNLVVNGHIVSGGATPTIAALAAACTAPTVSIAGTDTAGTITVTTGTGCGPTGDLATITFDSAFDNAPRITLTAADANSATLQSYIDSASVTTAEFNIGTAVAPTDSTTYKWNYHVIE